MRSRRRVDLRSDRGLTLTELLVYIVLLGIVMIVVTGIFSSVNNTQKTVSAVTTSSNQAQATANLISRSISNASAVKLVSYTSTDLFMKPGDQMLMLRTATTTATPTWVCQSWYYQAASGTIRFTTSPIVIPTPSTTSLQGWTALASGVTPTSGTTVFSTPVVTSSGTTVSFAFNVTGTGQKPQLIDTSSTTPLGTMGSVPCF